MQVFYDSDNNVVDLSKIATVLYTLELKADDGYHTYYVIRNHQYQFSDTVSRITDCDDLPFEYQNVIMNHYKFTVDEIDYYLPKIATTIEYNLRPMWQQDKRVFHHKISQQPKDYIGAYRDVTGIDIREGAKHNGTQIYEEHSGEDMFDNDYGTFKKDSEDSYEYADLNNT